MNTILSNVVIITLKEMWYVERTYIKSQNAALLLLASLYESLYYIRKQHMRKKIYNNPGPTLLIGNIMQQEK